MVVKLVIKILSPSAKKAIDGDFQNSKEFILKSIERLFEEGILSINPDFLKLCWWKEAQACHQKC